MFLEQQTERIKAAASEAKDTWSSTMHNLRYQIDYMKLDYRQRYYSNSKNPRVVHTKLRNQKLLSLRTFPRDKYDINAGEFLRLQKDQASDKDEVEDTVEEDDNNDLEDTHIVLLEKSLDRNVGRNLDPKFNLNSDLLGLEKSLQHNENALDVSPPGYSDYLLEKLGIIKRPALSPSPPSGEGPQEIPGSGQSEPWKAVLSAVSLSAARISTGSSSKKAQDFSSLTGDFVNAKLKTDFFAANFDKTYTASVLELYFDSDEEDE